MGLLGALVSGAAEGVGNATQAVAAQDQKLSDAESLQQNAADVEIGNQQKLMDLAAQKNATIQAAIQSARDSANPPQSIAAPTAPPPAAIPVAASAQAAADTAAPDDSEDDPSDSATPAASDQSPAGTPAQSSPIVIPQDKTDALIQRLKNQGDDFSLQARVYMQSGDTVTAKMMMDAANSAYSQAANQQDSVQSTSVGIDPKTGKVANIITMKSGDQSVSDYGVPIKPLVINRGGISTVVDENNPATLGTYQNTVSPDTIANNNTTRRGQDLVNARAKDTNARLAGPDQSTIPQNEKDLWLRPYIANGGVVGRSTPQFVKNNIATWAAEKGITADDLSSGLAQQKFDMASANTSGHRAGSMASVEAAMPALITNALDLSTKVDQGSFVPMNRLMQTLNSNISDPNMLKLKIAHQAVVSEYSQVIARGGVGNVTSLKESMDALNSATSTAGYQAALGQVANEVQINDNASKTVRSNLGPPKSIPQPASSRQPSAAATPGVTLNYNPSTGTFH